MLTSKDIQRIGEEVEHIIEQNIAPQPEEMRNDMQAVRNGLQGVRDELHDVGRHVNRVDGKVNILVNVLREKRAISGSDRDRVMV